MFLAEGMCERDRSSKKMVPAEKKERGREKEKQMVSRGFK